MRKDKKQVQTDVVGRMRTENKRLREFQVETKRKLVIVFEGIVKVQILGKVKHTLYRNFLNVDICARVFSVLCFVLVKF